MNHKISIIVPVYNVEKYISKCIESVLSQTYTDWELILVDDGSTDMSTAICDDYASKDSRISVIHKKNAGVSSARNCGLERADGQYVCFIDSDDWVEASYFADFKTDRYKADVYVSGAIYDTYGRQYSYKQYKEAFCNSINEMAECFVRQEMVDNGYPWGKLFRRDLLGSNSLRFDERLSINEDHVFILEYMLLATSMYVTGSYGYHYTVFDNSGRKLSSKVNKYEEIKTASFTFEGILKRMAEKWHLDGELIRAWCNGFVYQKRLYGIRSMILLHDVSCFDEECRYWKTCTNLPRDRKSRIILMIIRCSMPQKIKIVFLKLFYKFTALMVKRNIEKVIYKDIDGRSTGFFHSNQ